MPASTLLDNTKDWSSCFRIITPNVHYISGIAATARTAAEGFAKCETVQGK
jgi:hypothetical protein